MKKLSIPRQLLLLVTVSVGVTLLSSFVCYLALSRSQKDSAALTQSAMTGLSRSYVLLSRLAGAQGALQQLLRQKEPDEIEKGIKQVETNQQEAQELINNCNSAGGAMKKHFNLLAGRQKAVMDQFLLGNSGMAYEQFFTAYNPQYEALLKEVRAFHDTVETTTHAELQGQRARNRMTVWWCFGAIGMVLLALASAGWRMKCWIAKQLQHLASSLALASQSLADSSAQVSSASQSLAEGASEQAASLEETSASLEEMSSMTKRNASNARKANELAKQTRAAADQGAADMQAMAAAMETVKTSSSDIAKIIKTIDEIAFQTNILALNAAVEAARAGEAGMGFAVVADEVRNLAQRSAQAARETAAKIEGAIANTTRGAQLSGKVASGLQEIVIQVRQVDELVAEVAAASSEQSQGIDQVNTAVNQMDKVTQSNAAGAEESASAAELLNAQAASLKDAVAELLCLVEGANTRETMSARTAGSPLLPPITAEASKAPALARVKSNGNGHSPQKTAPAPVPNAAASRQGNDLPMAGDFKDF
jgi:hypothetical protein